MDVLSRGFIAPEEVAAAERQPIAMVRSHASWGSIIAGSLVCVSLLTLSSSLAYACGVPAFSGSNDYGVGAGIWSIVTAIVAFGVGGWLAGYLASPVDGRYRLLHGLMTWGLTVPLILLLFGGAGLMVNRPGIIGTDIHEMTIVAPRIGGAWGAFISLAVGLIAALVSGAFVDSQARQTSRTYAPTA
jgi:hypothetical protein